jgi:glycosyltransferase XagB
MMGRDTPVHRHITSIADHGPSDDELRLYGPLGKMDALPAVDPARLQPDPRLLDVFGPVRALTEGVLPIRLIGTSLMVAVADPATVPDLPALTGHRGTFLPHQASMTLIEQQVLSLRGAAVAAAAETRVAATESCRDWAVTRHLPLISVIVALLTLGVIDAPGLMMTILIGWGLICMVATAILKLLALIAMLRPAPQAAPPPIVARLPVVTIIVALYREADISHKLVQRLTRLDYPHDLLDVILAVEDDDTVTKQALAKATLPPWMRVIVMPRGQIRTKPRALNHALNFARGTIIGIYDAEDDPAPDQIRAVVTRFHQCGPDVACLQGILDFYNPRSNWLSRCFTVEYATWFRMMLPGLARLGLVLPLGGTTLFFRRRALEDLGAWDAHNVTEDADLGLRLARHGYRTELIDTVTMEEANCRLIPWVRQRSRWIKGYMMTWGVHMRDPALLLRQLGWARFLGVQVLFLGSISQALLVPMMWSLWAFAFGFDHPAAALVPQTMLVSMALLFAVEGVSLAMTFRAMALRGQGIKPIWALSAYFYYPIAAFAAYKALFEVLFRPFYWDKTSHGHFKLD